MIFIQPVKKALNVNEQLHMAFFKMIFYSLMEEMVEEMFHNAGRQVLDNINKQEQSGDCGLLHLWYTVSKGNLYII